MLGRREEPRREIEAGAGSVTAPTPLRRARAKACANGIEHDVARRLHQVLVAGDVLAPEAVAEQVLANVTVAPVRELGEGAVQELHSVRESAELKLNEQV